MKGKEIIKRSGGITLIALVITIIVLLILAGVTIATLTGDNGILTKATGAKNTANEAEIEEKIKLAYEDYYLGQHTQSGYTFQNALDKMFGEGVATVTESNGVYTVSVNEKTYEYDIASGTVSEKVIPQRHPDQNLDNTDIGIDMYGKPVNLNYWGYQINDTENNFRAFSYKGDIVSGKIIGEIPQYIIKGGKTYVLTSLSGAFTNQTQLTQAPAIPSSVTDMSMTFSNCNMLSQLPTIPNSVTNMMYIFQNCASLTTAPTIPNSVTNMVCAFKGCTSLTGNLVIEALNVSNFDNCLRDAVTNEGCSLVVSGNCPQLDNIIATAQTGSFPKLVLNPNVTKGQ